MLHIIIILVRVDLISTPPYLEITPTFVIF